MVELFDLRDGLIAGAGLIGGMIRLEGWCDWRYLIGGMI